MEVLGGSGEIADDHVVFGAELQESFQSGAGVLGALAFVAVGQEQGDVGWGLPLGFGRGDELIDDDLSAVGEVAKLRFPHGQHVRCTEGVAVVEAEDGELGEQGVVNAETALIFSQVLQRDVALTGLVIVKYGVAMAEGAAADVLAREANGIAFEKE